eukprot:TRINITY_DN8882_c0_g2_i3.p1 TRINITY_DN8882_c0_g2~~TRINITY_DN8882_c0_g2_i3.p1  ORF type:complete len:1868 (+),score=407.84 TRINITY_DN8882_c0_g2_i3:232-5835(+)
MRVTLLRLALVFLCLGIVDAQTIKYVYTSGSDSNDGSTTGTPYLTLEKALSSVATSTPLEIRMGPGVFVTNGTAIDLTGWTSLSIVGSGGIGCVSGTTGATLRFDWLQQAAYAEPALCHPSATIISGGQSASYNGHRIFTTTVSVGNTNAGLTLSLSDLVLRRGHAHLPEPHGGCMRLLGDNIVLNTNRVTFQDCYADGPTPTHIWGGSGAGQGGAIYSMGCGNTFNFVSTTFTSNFAGGVSRGGAVVIAQSNNLATLYTALTTCTANNYIKYQGGEMAFNWAGIPGSDTTAGGLYSLILAPPHYQNLTIDAVNIHHNAAYRGSGLKVTGLAPTITSITNSFVWANGFWQVALMTSSQEGAISFDMTSPDPGCTTAVAGCTPEYLGGGELVVGRVNAWTQFIFTGNKVGCADGGTYSAPWGCQGNQALAGSGLYLAGQHIAKIEDNVFQGNSASFGGAILASNRRPLYFNPTLFTVNTNKGNLYKSNTAGTGGAVNILADMLFMWDNNRFLYNTAGTSTQSGLGGAADIASYAFPPLNTSPSREAWHLMTNTIFDGNKVIGDVGVSGGIRFTNNANLPVVDSSFSNHEGTLGVAVSTAVGCHITFSGTNFTNNKAPAKLKLISMGGAIWTLQSSFELTLTNCRFTANSAGREGGAIKAEQLFDMSLSGCTFTNNTCTGSGGAIHALAAATGKTLQTTSCVFTQNSVSGTGDAEQGGGAITLAPGATYSDSNSKFIENSVILAGGGGIKVLSDATVRLSGTQFTQNSATARPGGALETNAGSRSYLDGCIFDGNEVIRQSAANYHDPTIPSSCVASTATSQEGGSGAHIYAHYTTPIAGCDANASAVQVVTGTVLNVTNSQFKNAKSVSGGIFCDSCDLRLYASSIHNNTASQFGGGVFVSKGEHTKFEMFDTVCQSNQAEIGGCIYYENRTLSTIKGHSIDDTGWSAATAFPRCNFTGNKALGYGPDYASDINEMVPVYQVTYRANRSADYPPGTVPPYDPLATPIYIVTDPVDTNETKSLLNPVTARNFSVEFRPGVAFNLYVQMRDHWKQVATSDLTGSGVISQLVPDSTRQPGLKAAAVSSSGITNVSRVFVGGSSLAAYSTYNWNVKSSWFRLDSGKVLKETFNFQMASTAQECLIGEKTVYDEDPVLIQRAVDNNHDDYVNVQRVIKSCTWCKAGSYAVETPATECKDCPSKGADCLDGGSFIKPKGNYWRHYDPTDNIYKCPMAKSCKGASTSKSAAHNALAATTPTPCQDGYSGPLCAVCADDWANAGKRCVKCGSLRITPQFVLFFCGILILIGVFIYYVYDKFHGNGDKEVKSTQALKILMKKKKTLARLVAITGQCKILVAYFQVVIAIMLGGSQPFPTDFSQLMDYFEIVNIDVVAMFRSMCVSDFNFYSNFLWNLLMPVTVIGLLVLYTWFTRPDPADESLEAKTHTSFCWKSSLMLLFIIYPNCSRVMLSMFNCHAIKWDDDTTKYFLRADYSIECFEGDWWAYMPWAALGVLLYPVGVPVLFYGLIKQYATNGLEDTGGVSLDDPVVKEKFDFLFARFVPDFWWYETSELLRKLLVGCIIPMFVIPGTATNTIVLLGVNLMYICMMMVAWPFKGSDDNYLMSLSLVAIQVTLFGTLLMNAQIDEKDNYADGITEGVLLGSTITLIALYIVMLCRFQLPFICNHGLPLAGLGCISKSKLNCFKPAPKKNPKDTVSVPLKMDGGPDGKVGIAMNPLMNQGIDNIDMDEDELDETIETYFHRYDLDDSHTVNSLEELQQLTTNLAFKLKLALTGAEIDQVISTAGELTEKRGMSLEDFRTWFKDNFLDFDESEYDYNRGGMGGAMMNAVAYDQNADLMEDQVEEWDDDDGDDGDGD